MSQIKKLSVKTVFGAIDLKTLIAADDKGKALPLMQVIGQAVSFKTGDSNYGEWTAIMGQFQCTNLETGEVFEGSTLFLPEVALVPLQVSLSSDGARSVDFAIRIEARYVKNGKPGGVPYEYTWVPLLPPDSNDPIQRIKNKLLALVGPAHAPAPDDSEPATPKGGRK